MRSQVLVGALLSTIVGVSQAAPAATPTRNEQRDGVLDIPGILEQVQDDLRELAGQPTATGIVVGAVALSVLSLY